MVQIVRLAAHSSWLMAKAGNRLSKLSEKVIRQLMIAGSGNNFRRLFSGFLIGLAGGIFGGLVGLGGGIVMIPLMAWLLRFTQHQAHGTSLVAIIFVSIVGAGTYFIHDNTDWKAACLLAASSIVAVKFGARFAHSLSDKKLRKVFGVYTVSMSILLLLKGLLFEAVLELSLWTKIAALLVTGAATGFFSGMMGVGGGAIMVPALVMLVGMPQHIAQGTSLLAMVPTSVSGAFSYHKLGNVVTDIFLFLAFGSIVGGYLGGAMANILPELFLRVLFAVILIWMGIKYMIGKN
jgi:hypothetical protein